MNEGACGGLREDNHTPPSSLPGIPWVDPKPDAAFAKMQIPRPGPVLTQPGLVCGSVSTFQVTVTQPPMELPQGSECAHYLTFHLESLTFHHLCFTEVDTEAGGAGSRLHWELVAD